MRRKFSRMQKGVRNVGWSHLRWFSAHSKPLSAMEGPAAAEPTLMSLRFGWALIAKKLSAICWLPVEAAAKQKPVMIPVGSVAVSKLKPSYHPKLLDHPMSARPANHPCPRRLQSGIGIAELSRAS